MLNLNSVLLEQFKGFDKKIHLTLKIKKRPYLRKCKKKVKRKR